MTRNSTRAFDVTPHTYKSHGDIRSGMRNNGEKEKNFFTRVTSQLQTVETGTIFSAQLYELGVPRGWMALATEEHHFISDASLFSPFTYDIDAFTSFITNFVGEITKQR